MSAGLFGLLMLGAFINFVLFSYVAREFGRRRGVWADAAVTAIPCLAGTGLVVWIL